VGLGCRDWGVSMGRVGWDINMAEGEVRLGWGAWCGGATGVGWSVGGVLL